MHIERIRFDRVFDIQPHHGVFSFASADQVTYGVHVPGRTIPREGAVWAVAFERPGDWSTLLGWRDMAAQRTRLTYQVRHLLVDQAWGVYWFAIPALALGLYVGGLWAAAAIVAAAAAGGVWMLRHVVLRNRRVRAALRNCITPPASPCSPPGSPPARARSSRA